MYRFGIFGKPNVGKSSLFNVIINQNKSIVAKERGVTRDRVRGILRDKENFLVLADLPGMEIEKKKAKKMEVAYIQSYLGKELKKIDVLIIIFAIDNVTSEDQLIYQEVKKLKMPLIFLVNKVDGEKEELLIGDVYNLGNEDFFLTSAKTRKNIIPLRQKLFSFQKQLQKKNIVSKSQTILANQSQASLSIIGKPNVGKSSFLNALLGWDRCLVKEEKGTTRDAVDEFIFYRQKKYKLIDTAGIRRKSAKKKILETLALKKTFHAINQADVVILIIDAKEVEENFFTLTEQDKKIISLVQTKKKTLIIFFNKWDLLIKSKKKGWAYFSQEVLTLQPFLKNFPLEPLSCKEKFSNRKKDLVFKKIFKIIQNHQIKIKTTDLNTVFKMALEEYDKSFDKKKILKIYYALQVKQAPPLIHCYINNRQYLVSTSIAFLKNYLVKYFNLLGTPLNLKFITKEKNESKKTRTI